MKMMRTLLLTCLLTLFAWQISAQAPVKIYSGESVPTAQGWTEQKLDATINDLAAPTTQAAASGVLKLTSTNAANQFSQLNWYKTGLDLGFSTGFTIEIKAKVTSADKTGAFNIQGFDKAGKGFRIGILSNAVTEQTDPFVATNVLATGLTNGDGFHIYRIVVAPNSEAKVYRDGVALGTFQLKTFQFDNIVENGGFEDDEFPDFISNAQMTLVTDPEKVRFGEQALELYNEGFVTNEWSYIEGARTREFALKPETKYELYITRRRTFAEPYCWRDLGAFYDFQKGTLGLKGENVDDRNTNVTFGSCNDDVWLTHPQDFTTPPEAKTIRLEFPTWIRDGNKFEVSTSLDNVILREKPTLEVVPAPERLQIPTLPAGITNLIKNGDFEDITINNDGTPYEWALASNGGETENIPAEFNELWNGEVRIQDQNKPDDFNGGDEFYAHSGTKCFRFSTLNMDGQGKGRNFDYAIELEAGKTYCFNFWHRSPKWDDWGWMRVRIGDDVIWGHELKGRNNHWANANLIFTTTAENKTLHIYTDSDSHGDWWNIYLDDLVLYEVPAGTSTDPQISGKTNLIANGDFENTSLGNDGKPYTWALASGSEGDDDNYPVAWSDMWGAYVRLQDKQKIHDTGNQWSNSGNNSLRFSYLNDRGKAQEFEGISGDVEPNAYRTNMNFVKELEPNKTYTFVFWIKTANYPDRGWLFVNCGERRIWEEELSTKYINWTRQSVTFSTTESDRSLRMYTELSGWYNFYIDDVFLFEEDEYIPPTGVDSYLAFGKSTGTSSTDVEIEYITLSRDETGLQPIKTAANLRIYPNPVVDGILTIDNIQSLNGKIEIYSIVGTLVKIYNVTGSTTTINVSSLATGTYIVRVDGKSARMLKK